MLRGINKYIIEINDPNNQCFEKVILFVRPEYNEGDYLKLKKEGEKIINTAELCGNNRPIVAQKNAKIRQLLSMIVGVMIGVVLMLLLNVI